MLYCIETYAFINFELVHEMCALAPTLEHTRLTQTHVFFTISGHNKSAIPKFSFINIDLGPWNLRAQKEINNQVSMSIMDRLSINSNIPCVNKEHIKLVILMLGTPPI